MSSPSAAARSALPYGAVMATAGASRLAGSGGLHVLALPLLWLAVVEAIVVALLSLWRRRQASYDASPLVPAEARLGTSPFPWAWR